MSQLDIEKHSLVNVSICFEIRNADIVHFQYLHKVIFEDG